MSKKILIVDDDLLIRRLLQHNLKKAGYRVSVAENGYQALKIVKKDKPDLIISDVVMPKLNGLELCKKLREDPDTKLIPIILMTSDTQIQDKLRDSKFGADDYLTKPFHLEDLLVRVHSLLERKDSPASDEDVD